MKIGTTVFVACTLAYSALCCNEELFRQTHIAGARGDDPEYANGPDGPAIVVNRTRLLTTIPFGEWTYSCKNATQVALTFDDGPLEYTQNVSKQVEAAGFRATFFIVGYFGYRKIYNESTPYPKLIRSLHKTGHQLASHTWTHMDLNDMNQNDRINQMLRSEKAFARTINLIPTYMRPPFGRCHKECLQDMGNLGYHVVFWNVDPKDSQFNTEKTYPEAIQRFDTDLRYGGSLVGCHDTEQYTAAKLVPHMIAELKKRGLQGVTLGECLGDPRENWYRHVLR